jgi:hypothetical protein
MTDLRQVRFYVRNSEQAGEERNLWEGRPDGIVQRSLGLKELIAETEPEGGICLEVPAPAEIDERALKFLLRNLQANSAVADGSVDEKRLSKQCNGLWKYQCNPQSFKVLLKGLQPSWSGEENQLSTTAYCWHQSAHSSPILTSFERINIAWVLGEDKLLREEIKTAVWNSNATPLTSVETLQNIRGEGDPSKTK